MQGVSTVDSITLISVEVALSGRSLRSRAWCVVHRWRMAVVQSVLSRVQRAPRQDSRSIRCLECSFAKRYFPALVYADAVWMRGCSSDFDVP
jgi:hypothetical protein